MSDLPDEIDRINALTSNARNTWFALLGVLVFVGITLMGVEHVDFYGVNRATKLPLVDVEVPTRYFFVAAPVLTAAIYGYFHLYLIRLWDALGAAPARLDDRPLGNVIAPWLVSDAALYYRNRVRKDDCATPRALESGAMLLNFLLAWLFGLCILFFLWRLSMPARTFWMTAISALTFGLSVVVGLASLMMMLRRMRQPPKAGQITELRASPWQSLAVLAGSAALLYQSHRLTEGDIRVLASLEMTDEQIVTRPGGWLDHDFAKAEFRAAWCQREQVDCAAISDLDSAFSEEWLSRRKAEIFELQFPAWHKFDRIKPDLRKAKLYSAFMTGINLWDARLEGAKLDRAQLEESALNFANMAGVKLYGTHLEGADLSYSFLSSPADHSAILKDANISAATNNGGALRDLSLEGVIFDPNTDFRNVFLDGTVSVPEDFARQMGRPASRPCQWVEDPLSDAEFFSIWRWWILKNDSYTRKFNTEMWRDHIALPGWSDVPLPTPARLAELNLSDCHWKFGPMTALPD